MGEVTRGGFGRWTFSAIVIAIAGLVAVQSVVHLVLTVGLGRLDTILDLDRSNGLPDVLSTVALAAGAAGAVDLARRDAGTRRTAAGVAAGLLAALTVADLMHDGAHPFRRAGPFVIGLVLTSAALLAFIGIRASWRARVTLVVATVLLGWSFLIAGLGRLDARFDRDRGEVVAEYQIVAKEGFELLGWSLVALALWDEALRRRRALAATTARASRAQAPSRRRAA